MFEANLIVKARDFAKRAHESVVNDDGTIGQLRKYSNQPYFIHPEEVATIIQNRYNDPEMTAAAYLHDTVEDTEVTREQIMIEFGKPIHDLVNWLTHLDFEKNEKGKYKQNRKTRKALGAEFLSKAPARAQNIKYVDILVNCRDIAEMDRGFYLNAYYHEKRAQMDAMNNGDLTLWKEVSDAIDDFYVIARDKKSVILKRLS